MKPSSNPSLLTNPTTSTSTSSTSPSTMDFETVVNSKTVSHPTSNSSSTKLTFAETLRNNKNPIIKDINNSNKPVRKRYSFTSPKTVATGTVNVTGSPSRAVLSQDHGIVLNSADFPHYTNADYFTSIKKIVPPNQVHSFTRTHGTFVVFFLDRSWAKQLILSGLAMHDCRLMECLPIGIPPVRVVVSEVPSHFENSHLREIMTDFGTVIGPIKTMRSSYQDPDMPHLLSFRRQVMMKFPSTKFDLPDRIFVDFNGITITFFVTTDVRCHSCGKSGHLRDECPSNTEKPATEQVEQNIANTSHTEAVPPLNKEIPVKITPQIVPDPTLPHAQRDRSVLELLNTFTKPTPVTKFTSPSSSTVLVDLASTVPKRVAESPSGDFSVKRKVLHGNGELPFSSWMSDVSDTSSIASEEDISDHSSVSNPITDSDLDSFFDRVHRSSLPILDHVRQFTDDPDALLRYLHRLRLDKQAFMASPLAAKLSPGAVYQIERKIRKALKAFTA